MLIDAGFEGRLSEMTAWSKTVEKKDCFSAIWVPDTANDPFLLAASAIGSGVQLEVGTSIAVAFSRSPYCTAQTAYNLAQLSKGRFTLGLGTQVRAHIERRFNMPWPDKPVAAMDEYLSLLRHLFHCFQTRERPKFKGEYFSCTLSSPVFTPDHHTYPSPKLGISAVGEQMTKLAGRCADAVFLHPFTHLKYVEEVSLPALAEGKAKRDEGLGPLQVVGSGFCLAVDSPGYRKMKEKVLTRLAFYASTPNYKKVLASLGLEELHTELHQLSRQGEWKKMAEALPSELVAQCVVEAPQANLIPAVTERYGRVYDRFVMDPTLLL